MKLTKRVQKILVAYEGESRDTKESLARILMHGRLGGTGRLVILPVDQGFEHGPARSFAPNPDAYDPHYHYRLAIEAGLSAYAAPLGMLEAGIDSFGDQIPTILKLNSANSLNRAKEGANQAVTGSVEDALRLGCSAVGFTIYPGSDAAYDMFEELRELSREAKKMGLAVFVWSYPRGGSLSREGETAIDVVAYAAHIACLLGANLVKVKLPTAHLELEANKKIYEESRIDIATLAARVSHVVKCCFQGKRLVIFSGGSSRNLDSLTEEVCAIRDGGGTGSIIGRNTFQRPREEALKMLDTVIRIYQE